MIKGSVKIFNCTKDNFSNNNYKNVIFLNETKKNENLFIKIV
jgi:hypothetical protein